MRTARVAAVMALVSSAIASSLAAAQPAPTQPPDDTAPLQPSPGDPSSPADGQPAPAPVTAPSAAPPPTTSGAPIKPEPEPVGAPIPAPVPSQSLYREPDSYRGFRFGSYGRVIAGTDLRGGKPETANIVAHGPRIVEPSYLELDFSYGYVTTAGVHLRPVVTLAFDGTLFHDTGDFDARPALRNMFLEAQPDPRITLWAGSRMYRGDDIYLFDYWPLDDLNTVGGGVMFHHGGDAATPDQLDVAAHVGFNRLNNSFTFQQVEVPNPEQGATLVDQLDRERIIASATASYLVQRAPDAVSMKLKLHGEFHGLPSGDRRRVNADGTVSGDIEHLPSDTGYLIGGEVSLFGLTTREGQRRHLNLYVRYAQGLAAFDELAAPTSVALDLSTSRVNELTFGASGNYDVPFGSVMLGALSRRFTDGVGGNDFESGWEYALDARPLVRVLPDTYVGFDISYQARFPQGLNPFTERAEDPSVFQIAPMIVYSPLGPSGYDRPQLRLVLDAAHANDGARDLYVEQDPRHAHAWSYFLGFQAEWWFNSSTYQH